MPQGGDPAEPLLLGQRERGDDASLLRVPLLCSQDMGVRAESIYLRAPEFFTAHDIEVWTEKEVTE